MSHNLYRSMSTFVNQLTAADYLFIKIRIALRTYSLRPHVFVCGDFLWHRITWIAVYILKMKKMQQFKCRFELSGVRGGLFCFFLKCSSAHISSLHISTWLLVALYLILLALLGHCGALVFHGCTMGCF